MTNRIARNSALEKGSLLMMIMYPYISVLLYVGFFIATNGGFEGAIPFSLIWMIQAVVFILAVVSTVRGTDLKNVAIVKFSYIPYYIVYFALDRYFSSFEQAKTWGANSLLYETDISSLLHGAIMETPFCFFLAGQALVLSGIYMLGLDTSKTICKILGFVPGLDIVAVIYLLAAKRNSNEKNEEQSSQQLGNETRKTVGQIILFVCLIASYVIVKRNIAVVIYEESITYFNNMIISASDAWLATIVWSLIGWIPNLVSTILLRKYGRVYKILLIISWILYLLVGPTGIANPIPMGV